MEDKTHETKKKKEDSKKVQTWEIKLEQLLETPNKEKPTQGNAQKQRGEASLGDIVPWPHPSSVKLFK